MGMLRRRWFDGLRGEDGIQVLSELLECGQLHALTQLDMTSDKAVFWACQNSCGLLS